MRTFESCTGSRGASELAALDTSELATHTCLVTRRSVDRLRGHDAVHYELLD